MQIAEAAMVLTPLEEIEAEVHEHFGDDQPTENEVVQFLRTSPKMDGGVTAIVIALAAVVLQGYQIYTERQRARIGAGGNCPTLGCGLPASSINKYSGRWECERGHSWK